MEYLLSTDCLTKKFKRQTAIDNISLHIRQGEIYGLIGKNGAGKTTFLKMISGLSKPTSGDITFFGYHGAERNKVISRIGVLIEAPGLYPDMSAYDNLKLKCICVGLHRPGYIENILNIVGLGNVGKKKVGHFSLGMKQRLGIGMALVGEPDVLVLDEPINGLDPEGIAEVRETLLRLNKEKGLRPPAGKTVKLKILGTGMISVMPVPLLAVHPRECSPQGRTRYVPSVCACHWTCPVHPHRPPSQAL